MGVTADMLNQNEEAIREIFKPPIIATGITVENQSQLPVVDSAETSTDSNISTQYKRSIFPLGSTTNRFSCWSVNACCSYGREH